MKRLAIIGDIGGHADTLKQILRDLGADEVTGRLPADLSIIQVGDLVRLDSRRGPDSDECVCISQRMLEGGPRWTQLWGNHDLAAIGGPRRKTWTTDVSNSTKNILREWWSSNRCSFAVAFASDNTDFLVTHAGLTLSRWEHMGRPSATEAADFLNNTKRNSPREVSAGSLVSGNTNFDVDVSWTEVNFEFYAPWIAANTHGARFNQIHGHASPWDWNSDAFWPGTPQSISSATTVEQEVRRTTTRFAHFDDGFDSQATSVDWQLENVAPKQPWPVLKFELA